MAQLEYTSVKTPKPIFGNIDLIQQRLIRDGLNVLPKEILEPKKCPLCDSELKSVEFKYEYLHCGNCGYSQQNFNAKFAFCGGVLLGVAFALLAYHISKSKS